MSERERNFRLFKLLIHLVNNKDLKSIELIETMIVNESPSMRRSFKIMKDSGNFNF
jgi:hypothetical protein